MRSIKEIFVIGLGPSSSHTMGPVKAVQYILDKYKKPDYVKVILYGSLALTGKGHLTDYYIDLHLKEVKHEIVFDLTTKTDHPNTMIFEVTEKGKLYKEKVVSIGGGSIIINDQANEIGKDIYPHNSMAEILEFCAKNSLSLVDYVKKYEDDDILDYIQKCFYAMLGTSVRGCCTEGPLPGDLGLRRKAPEMYRRLQADPQPMRKGNYELIMATYATATSEENACGGQIVIAPTAGSCGVIPGCLGYLEARGTPIEKCIDGMLVAGLIGMLCKTNGSVAGAEAGCQAEIGVACSMGAAMIAYCKDLPNHKIAQAAEIALEHSLGLTCDPIHGLVQVPCIERNAMYALKAKSAAQLAKIIPSEYTIISLDDTIKTMLKTGRDLQAGYRETSLKGLAELDK